ncbi:MAG: dihydroorotase [Alphaproteobacteria bacterium]|nr:dihydroorotase [Alphaproteobacteria bacterium]MCL2505484.1 dihydroorotase [Alphaproteobacteria bacterium]
MENGKWKMENGVPNSTLHTPHSTLTILRPDDFHIHLREGALLRAVLPFTASVFSRAILMPNLSSPLVSVPHVQAYRNFVEEELALLNQKNFIPLFTLYLRHDTNLKELADGYKNNVFFAGKLYPSNITTNSALGFQDIASVYPVFEAMEKLDIPLLVHGETPDPDVDIFDRESVFIDKSLVPIRKRFPNLRITLEHITTSHAVDYVLSEYSPDKPLKTGATITPHHLHINRTDIFSGGLNPHYYCMPIAKREEHRKAVVQAAVSGLAPFFLGTDSAPHVRTRKESGFGSAGIFNAPSALALYAQIFDDEQKLHNLETFASRNGALFYGLPLSSDTLTLKKELTSEKTDDIKPILTEDMQELVQFISPKQVFWNGKWKMNYF